jgi:hypothetical protein
MSYKLFLKRVFLAACPLVTPEHGLKKVMLAVSPSDYLDKRLRYATCKGVTTNAAMHPKHVRKHCALGAESQGYL